MILNTYEWWEWFTGNYRSNLYYLFNGVDTSIQLPVAYTTSTSESISISFKQFTHNDYSRFIGSEDYTFSVDSYLDGTFRLVGCTATLDGAEIVSTSTVIPTDEEDHVLVIQPTVVVSVGYVASLATQRYIQAVLFNIKLGEMYDIPVDDGWDSNPVLRNTLGESATLLNGVEDGWIGSNEEGMTYNGDLMTYNGFIMKYTKEEE